MKIPLLPFKATIDRDFELHIFNNHSLDTLVKPTKEIGFITFTLNVLDGQQVAMEIMSQGGEDYCVLTGVKSLTDSDLNFYIEDFSQVREQLGLNPNQIAYKIL